MAAALIIVDVQNDFTKGALSLENGPSKADVGSTIARINKLLNSKHNFDAIVYTMDYHPEDHCSFDIWPKHCVEQSWGAELDERLINKPRNCDFFIVKKGISQSVDSYSAFIDNDRKKETELRNKLKEKNIEDVFVCGFALDFCVFHTALDSANYGFKTTILEDCTASYNLVESKECSEKLKILKESGVKMMKSTEL